MIMNLLPWREQREKRWKKWVIIRCIVYVILISVVMIFFKYHSANNTLQLIAQNNTLEQKMSIINIKHIKSRLLLLHHLKTARIAKKQSDQRNNLIATLLAEIANDLPAVVTLKSLSITQNKLTLTGVSPELLAIHQFSLALSERCYWKQVQLKNIQSNQNTQSDVHFTVEITP